MEKDNKSVSRSNGVISDLVMPILIIMVVVLFGAFSVMMMRLGNVYDKVNENSNIVKDIKSAVEGIDFSSKGNGTEVAQPTEAVIDEEVYKKVLKMKEGDHVRGDRNAKFMIVEYSDPDCPFCERYHETMKQIMEEYPSDVAWVYRHFPLDSLHPLARRQSEASECVADIAGEDAFWTFIDSLFEDVNANSDADLKGFAENAGADGAKFIECLESEKFASDIQNSIDDAVSIGGRGTPFPILVGNLDNAEFTQIPGAVPFETMKEAIDFLIEEQD